DPDPLGLPAEGQHFLGFVLVTTGNNGVGTIDTTGAGLTPFTAGQVVTATATDPNGNTSEFSPPPASSVTVTGTGDTVAVDGVVTLREAIESLNQGSPINADVTFGSPGGTTNVIDFNIAGGGGVKTISPTSALPAITVPVIIDGYSQPGSSVNTLA